MLENKSRHLTLGGPMYVVSWAKQNYDVVTDKILVQCI